MTVDQILVGVAVAAGIYMAWNIGANDVANAFGTSVGSGALTIKRAIVLAAIFEFAGAFLVGDKVAGTISGNIVNTADFSALSDNIGLGMLAALIASSIWLNVATHFGQPVSTTHAIIGAVIGFGIVAAGPQCIQWDNMGTIVASWVISPIFGGVLAYAIYRFAVKKYVLDSRHPVYRTMAFMPIAIGSLIGVVAFSITYNGLHGLKLDMLWWQASIVAIIAGSVALITARLIIGPRMVRHGVRRNERYRTVERWFGYMQISTACYMSFAHGANDVANAIGPLASALHFLGGGAAVASVPIPTWVLAMGGVGIVLGLATYGYKVIAAIGTKITEMTPTRGFSAEFGTATSVLVFSKMGMPISTTFVIVGAVMGVGFARGFGAIDLGVIRKIFASWLITIPISGVLTAIVYSLMVALTR